MPKTVNFGKLRPAQEINCLHYNNAFNLSSFDLRRKHDVIHYILTIWPVSPKYNVRAIDFINEI